MRIAKSQKGLAEEALEGECGDPGRDAPGVAYERVAQPPATLGPWRVRGLHEFRQGLAVLPADKGGQAHPRFPGQPLRFAQEASQVFGAARVDRIELRRLEQQPGLDLREGLRMIGGTPML